MFVPFWVIGIVAFVLVFCVYANKVNNAKLKIAGEYLDHRRDSIIALKLAMGALDMELTRDLRGIQRRLSDLGPDLEDLDYRDASAKLHDIRRAVEELEQEYTGKIDSIRRQ